jgi:hypothetical protein
MPIAWINIFKKVDSTLFIFIVFPVILYCWYFIESSSYLRLYFLARMGRPMDDLLVNLFTFNKYSF